MVIARAIVAAVPDPAAGSLLLGLSRAAPKRQRRKAEATLAQLRCEKQLLIVPGATHLFEKLGALDEVARLARDWFLRNLI